MSKPRTSSLAGNPNVGKSTVFNADRLNQHTGNWPGKTVGPGERWHKDAYLRFVDLPGTYRFVPTRRRKRWRGLHCVREA